MGSAAEMSRFETSESQISDEEFAAISHLVYQTFGIVLGAEKRSLVVGRLHSCLTRRGLKSFSDYLRLLKADKSGEILSELVNHISTNFTSFFREASHFDFLASTALPEVLQILEKKRSNDLRVWCAACSSGEEAYTIQMTIMRKLGLQYSTFDAGLLATDISVRMLDVARRGVYTGEQLDRIPEEYRNGFFKSLGDDRFAVKDNMRNQILFRRLNLMNAKFPFGKPFQIIFCRNVMIYFDEATRRRLIEKFHDVLEPGGYLFIGHSETINSEWSRFQNILPAVYRKRL